MDDPALSTSSWVGGDRGHLCNCIGCCQKCGMCRTHPDHVPDICGLRQRQQKELEAALELRRVARASSSSPATV